MEVAWCPTRPIGRAHSIGGRLRCLGEDLAAGGVSASKPRIDVELLEDLGEVAPVPSDEGAVAAVDRCADVADPTGDGLGDLWSVVLSDAV